MIIAECPTHGAVEFRVRKTGYKVCVACNRERVYEWRRDAKKKLVEMHGGKCQLCGYNRCMRALQFHHRDPQTKKFSISAFSSCLNMAKLIEESHKCILLCSNCHAEVEDGMVEA